MEKKKFLNKTLLFILAAIMFIGTAVAVFVDDNEKLGDNDQIIKVEEGDDLEEWIKDHQATTPEADKPKAEYVVYTFRNQKYLDEDFEKHGKAMGFATDEEYEKAACDVINSPKADSKTEKEDGDFVFYIEETNEFVILSKDGYIRTYFLPDAGKDYFDRQ